MISTEPKHVSRIRQIQFREQLFLEASNTRKHQQQILSFCLPVQYQEHHQHLHQMFELLSKPGVSAIIGRWVTSEKVVYSHCCMMIFIQFFLNPNCNTAWGLWYIPMLSRSTVYQYSKSAAFYNWFNFFMSFFKAIDIWITFRNYVLGYGTMISCPSVDISRWWVKFGGFKSPDWDC